jgi:hypothetical protein
MINSTLDHTYWNDHTGSTFNIDTSSTPSCGVVVIVAPLQSGITVTIGGVNALDEGSGVWFLGNVTNNASLEVVVSGEGTTTRIFACVFSYANKFVACGRTTGAFLNGEHCTATCAAEDGGMAVGVGSSGWYIAHTGFGSGTEHIHHVEYGGDGKVNWIGAHKVENSTAVNEEYTWAFGTGGTDIPITTIVATVVCDSFGQVI